MSSFAFDTAGTIVNDTAVEVGLTASSDPFASTDPNFIQLRGLLKSLGRELWRRKRWTWLQQVYTFTSVTNQARYDLPADFGFMIEQTGWNRTNRLPLGGPLSPQLWEYLKARLVGVVFTVLFRPVNRQLWLYPDTSTPGSYVIAFEYLSRYWVIPTTTASTLGPWSDGLSVTTGDRFTNGGNIYIATSTATTGTSGPTGTGVAINDGGVTWNYVSPWGAEDATTNDDTILYDPLLVVRGLRLAFLKAKGFDTTAAQGDFDDALAMTRDADSDSPILNLTNTGSDAILIGERNIPVTGFGP